MPDLPEEALQAALARARSQPLLWQYISDPDVRELLEAAAPVLAARARRDTVTALRAVAETRELLRRFTDRHPELHEGVTVRGVLLAVAEEIEGEARDSS